MVNEGKPQHNSIKISWSGPANPNGTLTGYNIYVNGERVSVVVLEKTAFVVKDLPHSTSVAVQVAGVTSAGEGEKSAPIMCSTLNLSKKHSPQSRLVFMTNIVTKLSVNVLWYLAPM